MAQQSRSERLVSWLNRQALLQDDGTYLVRPFSRLPLIYQVDTATKDRLIANQVRTGRFAIVLMAIFFIVCHGQPWALTWGFLAFCVVLFGVGYGVPLIIIRGSRRVPRERWVGPAVIDPDGRFPRKVYLVMMLLSAGLALLFVYSAWSTPVVPSGGYDWQVALGVAFFAALAVIFAKRWHRTAPKVKRDH